MILQIPNTLLSNRVNEVDLPVSESVLEEIGVVKKQLASMSNAVGIAANQMGFSSRFFCYKHPNTNVISVCINPSWKLPEGSPVPYRHTEGCLSIEEGIKMVEVPRHWKLDVRYYDLVTKKWIRSRVDGFEAAIFQHEIDHLNGICLFDREYRK